jgi:Bifunctional DNA primase/polymerase, N-terminal
MVTELPEVNLYNEALRYAAEFQWAVFPLIPRGKRPATRHGVKDATTNTAQVKAWWTRTPEFNIGVATGRASGFFVVDVDGEIGLKSLTDLLAQRSVIKTRTVMTGGGGLHLYFRMPARDHVTPDQARDHVTPDLIGGGRDGDVRNRAGLLPGIDIRGDGGYVVVPPSLHESGQRYKWLEESEVADAPQWLLDLLMPTQTAGHRAYVDKACEEEIAVVAGAVKGARNDTLNRAAFNLGTLVGAGLLDRGAMEEALLVGCRLSFALN